ncbi:MAG: SDR family NAD(P)-dependent oxidoreductase [Legionellales bacterium]|nr:SDR family NAD(P)-dependent oxidoreductase [Legionellales bacterium]
MNIQGHYVLITGGASGLGAETAHFLAQKGARIILFDRDLSTANQVAEALGGKAYEVDVANSASVEQAFNEMTKEAIYPRVCINCAGIAPAKRMVGKEGPMALSDFEHVIQVNLVGTFNVMRIAAATMMQLFPLIETSERGVIINTASIAAYEGQIGQTAYSASKGGVVGMTLPAARELARFGIRVMTIAPGVISTPMMQAMPQKVQDTLVEQAIFPPRLGKPEEYAMLAHHIIENPLLNGEVIRLDGAMRMM